MYRREQREAAVARANLLSLGAVGLGSILLSIAHRRGFFRKHRVDVSLLPVPGTEVPELSMDNPIGYMGAPAALMRAGEGANLKIVASFDTARLSGCLVVRPGIRQARHLRGKRLGARVTGAALWIHTTLALRQLGLDPDRDLIDIAEVGDPVAIVAALEAGHIDAAVLPRSQCEPLTRKGFSILLDLLPCNVYGAPDALVAQVTFMQEQRDVVDGLVAGLIEGSAFALSSHTRPLALEAVMSELALDSTAAASAGLAELSQIIARKPYPSLERLADTQRIMARGKPAVLGLSIQDIVDDGIVRKLDEAGFIDRTYAAYGVT